MSQSKRRLLGVSLSKFPEWMRCHTPLESSSRRCSNINLGVNHFHDTYSYLGQDVSYQFQFQPFFTPSEWPSGQRVCLMCRRSPVQIGLETYLFYSFILIFFTILQTYKCFLNKVNASPNSSPFVEFAGNMNLFVQDRKFEQEMEDDIFQSKIQFLFENKLPLP